jgi:hypothetical protein
MNAGQGIGVPSADRSPDEDEGIPLADRLLQVIVIGSGIALATGVLLLKVAITVQVTGLLLGTTLLVLGAVIHRVEKTFEIGRDGLRATVRPYRPRIRKRGSSAPLSEEGVFPGPFRVNLP